MIIVEIIQYGLVAIVALLLGYQLLLSFMALRAKRLDNFKTSRNRKFAILLPVHNQEKVISKTLYSLFGLVYPKNLYDLIVIADNCNDSTAKIARKLGATVLERFSENENEKVPALQWAFDQIMKWDKKYDAFIFFDPESLVSGNYLEVMNYYLEKDYEVIQGSDLILPQPEDWSSKYSYLGYLFNNFIKPLGRKMLGSEIGIHGNGVCISTSVLLRIPWQNGSCTRFSEYGLRLILNGVDLSFAPEASVWSRKAAFKAGNNGRNRKSSRSTIFKEYAPRLFSAFIQRRSIRLLDPLIDFIMPSLLNTLMFVIMMCGLNLVMWLVGWVPIEFLWAWFAVGILGVLHLLAGLKAAEADWAAYKSLFYIPFYAFWKVKILRGNESENGMHKIYQEEELSGVTDISTKSKFK